MCGIGGIICFGETRPTRELITNLFEANAFRGRDATGIAFLQEGKIAIRKSPTPTSVFLTQLGEEEGLWNTIQQSPIVLIHTRAKTKGSEKENENNHPVTLAPWAVVHNGWINNDQEIFETLKAERFAEVDSAAIPLVLCREGLPGLRLLEGQATFAAWNSLAKGEIILGKIKGTTNPLFVSYLPGEMLIFTSVGMGRVLPRVKFGDLSAVNAGFEIYFEPMDGLQITTEESLVHFKISSDPIPTKAKVYSFPLKEWVSTYFNQPTDRDKQKLEQIPPMQPEYLFPQIYYDRIQSALRLPEFKTVFGAWALNADRSAYFFRPNKGVRKWTHRHRQPLWWNKEVVSLARPLLRVSNRASAITHICPWCGVVGDFKSWDRAKTAESLTGASYMWQCPYCKLPVEIPSVPVKLTVIEWKES